MQNYACSRCHTICDYAEPLGLTQKELRWPGGILVIELLRPKHAVPKGLMALAEDRRLEVTAHIGLSWYTSQPQEGVIMYVGGVSIGRRWYLWHNPRIARLWSGINRIAMSTDKTMCCQMFQLLNNWKQDVQVEVISCHICAIDILFEDGPSQEQSTWKPLIHEHDNLLGTRGYITEALSKTRQQ